MTKALAWVCALLSAFVLGSSLWRADLATLDAMRLVVFYLAPALMLCVFLISTRLTPAVRLGVLLNGVAIVAALYGYEAYTGWQSWKSREGRIAAMEARTGEPFDRRAPHEILVDLRASGVDAYPSHAARFMPMPIDLDGVKALVLTGRSQKPTVLCNESGRYLVYAADEYGFNNPRAFWSGGDIDIAALGDSFVHGACVRDDQNIVSILRRRWPRTANLGYGGTGTLAQLAIEREYLRLLKPRMVVWFYFENDLENNAAEREDPILMAYLRGGFTARLPEMQPLIDRRIDEFVAGPFQAVGFNRFNWRRRAADLILLRGTRERLGLNLVGESLRNRSDDGKMQESLSLMVEALLAGRKDVEAWGGSLMLVYLPGIEHFIAERSVGTEWRERVLAALSAEGFQVIDLLPVFAAQQDAAKRLFYYPGSHYTPEGYSLVAETVAPRLAAQMVHADGAGKVIP